jgi:hypothetical protein
VVTRSAWQIVRIHLPSNSSKPENVLQAWMNVRFVPAAARNVLHDCVCRGRVQASRYFVHQQNVSRSHEDLCMGNHSCHDSTLPSRASHHSHHPVYIIAPCMQPPADVTRFRSPPDTPRSMALPTTVSAARCKPSSLMMSSTLRQG